MKENRKNEYGCLMAIVDDSFKNTLLHVNNSLVSDDILYIDPEDPSYGRDDEPHVTVKFGFDPDLTHDEIKSVIAGIKPFHIKIIGLSRFQTEKFDVIKYDIEESIQLKTMRKRCDMFPNEDSHPVYHPHMTVAYVKPNTFEETRENLNYLFPITKMKYSFANDKSEYIKL